MNWPSITALFVTLSLICSSVSADELSQETDWLELTPGFIGKKLGAQINKVEKLDESELTRIEISLPHDDKRKIEQVIVRGKRGSSEYDIDLNKRVEVIKDLEQGKTGIVVHVGGDKPFKLLINYIDYSDPKSYQ